MLKINGARRFERERFYPFSRLIKFGFKYLAVVGVGANIAPEKWRFKALFRKFLQDKRLRVFKSSPILINKAFGFVEQKDFSNAVILIQTSLGARAFLRLLLYYELKFKRKRSFKNAPRTLDLDLLYFGAMKSFYKNEINFIDKNSQKPMNVGFKRRDEFCSLPHFGANERLSVILPLGLL